MRNNKHAFTLVELIVVMIIIGILATVAVPMMQGIKAKAIATEAAVGLGAIRTALRQYYVENNGYPPYAFEISSDGAVPYLPGLSLPSLTGTYFSRGSYWYQSSPLWIFCGVWQGGAAKSDEVIHLADGTTAYIAMDVITGQLMQYDFSATGYDPAS